MLVAGTRLGQKRYSFGMEQTGFLANGPFKSIRLDGQMDRRSLAGRRSASEKDKSPN